MAMRFHPCAAVGCTRSVPASKLMCIDHWRLVPRAIQAEVYAAWALRSAGVEDGEARHRRAMAAAMRAVAYHEKPAPAPPPLPGLERIV